MPTHGAKVKPRLAEIFAAFRSFKCKRVQLRMHLLSLNSISKHAFGPMAVSYGLFKHRRIHLRILKRLAIYRRLKVVCGRPDSIHGGQMRIGVNLLRLSRGAEQSCYVGKAVLLRLAGKGIVLATCLAFTRKRLLQIILCIGHVTPP